jgi:plastocyanin
MEKLNFQSRAAARCAELFETCPPKVSAGLRGGYDARDEFLETIHEFNNLGGKPMKRLTFSLICVLTFIGIALSASLATADDRDRGGNATVSFGQWDPNAPNLLDTEKPLDRLLADPGMGRGNNHEVLPNFVKIKEGDSVSFIISGAHVLAVYDDKTKPEDIDRSVIEPAASCPTTAGGIISDPIDRIYRGPCFSTVSTVNTVPPANVTLVRRDGVEVVQFTKPGTYLVICARGDHFFNPMTQEFEMFGFVKVEKDKYRSW